MQSHLHLMVVAAALAGGALCRPAAAGEFIVSPVRLELGATARSGAITVRNEGKERLSFQLEAMEWRQDADGKDQYEQTQELVFFPRIMSVGPGEEALIRVGAKTPLVQREKTFRLFIQEMPAPGQPPPTGAQVNFLIRFGAPIFVVPVKAQDSLAVERLELVKGAVNIAARNSGNRHQVVQGIHLKGADAGGAEIFTLTLADRYLLSGTAKTFSATVPPQQCARITSLTVEVRTDRLSTVRKLDVDPTMCP
jgi:fimbrial chaperone protein